MTSRTTVLAVVIALASISLVCVGGAIALIAADKAAPDSLWNLATFCAGAIAALLASTRSTLGLTEVEPTVFSTAVKPSSIVADSLAPIAWTAPTPPEKAA